MNSCTAIGFVAFTPRDCIEAPGMLLPRIVLPGTSYSAVVSTCSMRMPLASTPFFNMPRSKIIDKRGQQKKAWTQTTLDSYTAIAPQFVFEYHSAKKQTGPLLMAKTTDRPTNRPTDRPTEKADRPANFMTTRASMNEDINTNS